MKALTLSTWEICSALWKWTQHWPPSRRWVAPKRRVSLEQFILIHLLSNLYNLSYCAMSDLRHNKNMLIIRGCVLFTSRRKEIDGWRVLPNFRSSDQGQGPRSVRRFHWVLETVRQSRRRSHDRWRTDTYPPFLR